MTIRPLPYRHGGRRAAIHCRLLLIEAKCIGNPEVRSVRVAKVVCQVKNYECHIKRDGVLAALNSSLCVQSRLIKSDLGQAKRIASRVPVLILDPAHRCLSLKSRDTWLRAAVATSPNCSFGPDEVAVIDGMSGPPTSVPMSALSFPSSTPRNEQNGLSLGDLDCLRENRRVKGARGLRNTNGPDR
jgi:hypothetical protein